MTANPTSLARASIDPRSRLDLDRRRHRRCTLTLLGRFMRASKQEYPCKSANISVGGACIISPVPVYEGERIIAYFDQIGGIEGTVVRVFDGGFAIRISASQHKREKLAAQLTWLISKPDMPSAEERRHERIALSNRLSTLKIAEGVIVECKVFDISLSGASIGTDVRPPIGAEVALGKLRCRVVRHHDTGIAVQFTDIQEPEALRRYFG
jgi:hypothetical protein